MPYTTHSRTGCMDVWTLRALSHGKHVLCEKPFTANADEAQSVADAAAASGLVVMEAFHWRYHPMAARMLEVIARGELGEIRGIEADCASPFRDSKTSGGSSRLPVEHSWTPVAIRCT